MAGSQAIASGNFQLLCVTNQTWRSHNGFRELTVKHWHYVRIFQTKFCGDGKTYPGHRQRTGGWNSTSAWARPSIKSPSDHIRVVNLIKFPSLVTDIYSIRQSHPGFVFLFYTRKFSTREWFRAVVYLLPCVLTTHSNCLYIPDCMPPLEQDWDTSLISINTLGALRHIAWFYRIK